MLLSLVVHTYSLRYWFPATVMLGSAPAYLLSWGAWRLLSTVLPARMYHKLDDRLYSMYQSMVLFFFENYTGVEVSDSTNAQCPLTRSQINPWNDPRSFECKETLSQVTASLV